LKDGSVIIGSLVDASGTKLVYDSLGGKREIESKDVLRTEKDLSSLGTGAYDVTLTDNTVFAGSITDYDPDIGLFINLSIGALTLPASGIKSIVDPAERRRWVGSKLSFRASGYYYWPLADANFGPSYSVALSCDARLPWRGMTAGAAIEWSPLSYRDSSSVTYSILSAVPRLGYRYLGFRSSKGLLSAITPFASLGAGIAYIGVEDGRPGSTSSSYGAVVLRATSELGLDIRASSALSIRLSGRPDVTVQSGAPFATIGLGLSASWEIER
jgi:hypothetical protein